MKAENVETAPASRTTLQQWSEEHLRDQAALREESRLLELLNQPGQSIASQLEIDKLLQTVTDAATELTGARFGAFFYNGIDAQGEAYLLYTLSGAPREAFEKFGHPRPTALFGPTFRGEAPLRIDDVTRDPRYGTMAPHHGMPPGHLPVRSYLAVAVRSRSGEVLGGLFFGHPEPGRFSERSERLVVGMAAQAAVAIDNARLFEAAQAQIAERQRAEAALRDIDRRKDEFLATLAHELRNPLAPIRQATLLSRSEKATPEQKAWAHDVITRQVRNMSVLLDDLLDISRITRGSLELRPQPTPLAGIVDSALEIARPVIDEKRQTLEVRLPARPVEIDVDALRLSQALSNLLTNAARYTDPEGRIEVTADAGTEGIVIRVRDNGIGISAEQMPKIFEMFARVREKQERSECGLGIGLALSRGLIELQGGRITVHSEGPGKGSEFAVHLPASLYAAPSLKPGPEPVMAGPRRRRVLVADDNTDAGESLAMLLRLDGHEVEIARNGPEALELYSRMRPEVAILDIGMPGLSGYDVARRIRQRQGEAEITLIALTGWGQASDKARAAEAGFDHHFTKPVEPSALSALISE
jgi:signal transduction histidine kinase/CheY-like chemotaxis protein